MIFFAPCYSLKLIINKYQRTIFKVKQKSLYFVFILKPQKIVKKKNEHMTNNFKNLCNKK